jgi:hypothetical protein
MGLGPSSIPMSVFGRIRRLSGYGRRAGGVN